jgi:hypothetical protein
MTVDPEPEPGERRRPVVPGGADRRRAEPDTGRYALNAYGLVTAELVLCPAVPPGASVRLAQAQVGTFEDCPELWAAVGGIDVEGFDYRKLNDTHVIDTRMWLLWLEQVVPDYAPGP